jgi:hypothetical protein
MWVMNRCPTNRRNRRPRDRIRHPSIGYSPNLWIDLGHVHARLMARLVTGQWRGRSSAEQATVIAW